jgi:hypothetical protein
MRSCVQQNVNEHCLPFKWLPAPLHVSSGSPNATAPLRSPAGAALGLLRWGGGGGGGGGGGCEVSRYSFAESLAWNVLAYMYTRTFILI